VSAAPIAIKNAPPGLPGRLAALDAARFPARLWERDAGLWSDDAAHRAVAANRLGWLAAPEAMRGRVAETETFAREVAREGFTHALLLGMGGSSLAPEVLRLAFGVPPGRLDLAVLDNTSPAAVRAMAAGHDPARTLFIVSSKSGGTIEVASFEAFFFDAARRALGERAGRSFVAITDPGTALERLAAERGYRRVFVNPPDIGGRYSALSLFGLVPAALIGADPAALIASAAEEARASGGDVPAARNPGVALGAALGELALAGRDKLTLILDEEIAPLGSWIEQLVAESTGKDGKGIVPVDEEAPAAPGQYAGDRVFVALSVGPASPAVEARLATLAAAGHPVLRWTRTGLSDLGAEFLRWEIATATASLVLGVDPFDEPNVTEAKTASRVALDRFLADGRFPARDALAREGAVEIEAPPGIARTLQARLSGPEADPFAWAAALAALAHPADYLALLAYAHRTDVRHALLQQVRHALRDATRLATTLGYGPRFLHSTGQLHKGGPDNGVFLLLTADEGECPIPGAGYGFGELREAQARGDYEVLARRGRRVVHLHLGADVEAALERLAAAVARCA
jgi:hypothetical protein